MKQNSLNFFYNHLKTEISKIFIFHEPTWDTQQKISKTFLLSPIKQKSLFFLYFIRKVFITFATIFSPFFFTSSSERFLHRVFFAFFIISSQHFYILGKKLTVRIFRVFLSVFNVLFKINFYYVNIIKILCNVYFCSLKKL